jgi:hypothetical protein
LPLFRAATRFSKYRPGGFQINRYPQVIRAASPKGGRPGFHAGRPRRRYLL